MRTVSRGRFAPSPTGVLHVGNLRTAIVAYVAARSAGGDFVVRIEDLDRANSSFDHELSQIRDIRALGMEFDAAVVRQSDRFAVYDEVIADLTNRGLTYECFCSRREIREAASAPHGALPDGAYPGMCRDLSRAERDERRSGRSPAIRLRTDGEECELVDAIRGAYRGAVDDVVLRRNDGVPAYNLAVVVDDAWQGVTQVVRGDDLLSSTPRQIHLQRLLGHPTPEYAHVPLVLGADGERLAKRHGAVTLDDLAAVGESVDGVRDELLTSLGLPAGPLVEVARVFEWSLIMKSPWTIPTRWQTRG
ncbi:MAG: tRNA glutamyl-Q(34) synthetase GluQRS [Acidimicrobiales bacterium mtb01]|nr:tRNA glutamyl-Q(34) synthetase GluQRS [Actinomycetota bacterium]TEX46861.1 MAG: tRNA glutamyl-Q(34) synthetase GluQRS [Acidimicrobiales bacterium mtb01]